MSALIGQNLSFIAHKNPQKTVYFMKAIDHTINW